MADRHKTLIFMDGEQVFEHVTTGGGDDERAVRFALDVWLLTLGDDRSSIRGKKITAQVEEMTDASTQGPVAT